MKKVAILTTFFEDASGYSLIAVVETQIRMLQAHGYEPVMLVDERFKATKPLWQRTMTDVRPVIPAQLRGVDRVLSEHLTGVDVCITHDAFLLSDYRPIAEAIQGHKNPHLLWLHWLHSCPTPGQYRDDTPPPGYLIYPNASDKARVVQTYKLAGQEYRVIPCRAAHAIDPLLTWNYDPLTRSLMGKFNLLDAEISAVYPARLDRGKNVEKILYLLAGVQKVGYSAKLLVIDWQSAGAHFQKYIDELLVLAKELGLDVAFTSRLDDRCNQGVPPHVVTELMDLSTIYIHPSRVETYSLVTHQAILRGKLACLNFDFPATRELFGECGIYFDFGSDRIERVYQPDERTFWNDEAHRLIAELRQNRALMAQIKARREWNPNAMWRKFEPLLYLEPA